MIDVSAATTAELVAFYNKHAAKPVNKFADRKTAERRVTQLVEQLPPKARAKSAEAPRSDKIAASWQDKSVAAARATRHGVRVTDPKGGKGSYRSVREAFMVLALPLGRHIRFRAALKAAGAAEIDGHKFALIDRA